MYNSECNSISKFIVLPNLSEILELSLISRQGIVISTKVNLLNVESVKPFDLFDVGHLILYSKLGIFDLNQTARCRDSELFISNIHSL